MNDKDKAIEYYKAKSYEDGGLRDKFTKLAIEALEKQLNGGWIAVSERLPNESNGYLATIIRFIDNYTYVNELVYEKNTDNWLWGDDPNDYFDYKTHRVIAWQPLPPAWKGENNYINHPKHYADRDIEVIDYIKDNMPKNEFKGYLEGNVIKYISRYKKKNGLQDLLKCKWYLERLIKEIDNETRTNLQD